MIAGLITREQLAEKVKKYEGLRVDDVILGEQEGFVPASNKGIIYKYGSHNEEAVLTAESLSQLVTLIGMPVHFASKLPTDLLLPQLNYFYREKLGAKGLRLILSEKTNNLVAVTMKTNVDFISLSVVIDQIEKKVGAKNIEGYHRVELGWDSMMISVVLSKTFEVVKSDLLNPGIRFEHSILGVRPTTMTAYIFRQVCTNGAISADEIEKFSRRNRIGAVDDWARVAVDGAMKAIDREKERLLVLSKIKTEKNTATILDGILSHGGVPRKLREEVRQAALNDQPQTLYDLYNTITKVGTHSNFFDQHSSSRFALEGTASSLTQKCHLCNSCHRPLP